MKMRPAHSVLSIALFASTISAATPTCPPLANGSPNFPNTLVMSTGLAVNPDGAAASYAPGDHGFTYILNGVNMISNGKKVGCSIKENNKTCRTAWHQAEAGNFQRGTPEFCSYAIVATPVTAGTPLENCEGNIDRFILGNGKGRPAVGRIVKNVEGNDVTTYLSSTALQHTIAGQAVYIDSSRVPGIVVPQGRSDLVGAVAWGRRGGRSTFAIVNDTGPSFGEGTIALYQALFYDSPPPEQPIGPIPLSLRCGAAEKLQPPFVSRPDLGSLDGCKSGYLPKGASDIRAYKGVPSGFQSVILTSVKPPMKGGRVLSEITPAFLKSVASAAGYDESRLASMADCLPKN